MESVRLVIDGQGLFCWVLDTYDGPEKTVLGPFQAVRYAYTIVPGQLLIKSDTSYEQMPGKHIFSQTDRDVAQRMAEGLAWQVSVARSGGEPGQGVTVPLCVDEGCSEQVVDVLLGSNEFVPALVQIERQTGRGIRAVVVNRRGGGVYGGDVYMDNGATRSFAVAP